MIHSKEMIELKVILTYANGTIKRDIFAIGEGWVEGVLTIITIASNMTKKERDQQ